MGADPRVRLLEMVGGVPREEELAGGVESNLSSHRLAGTLPAPLMTALRWDEHRARRRLEVTKTGSPPCDATLNLELVYAKQMLSWGVERGFLKRNPLQAAKPVETLSRRETRVTADDIDRIITAADDVVDRRLAEGDDDGRRAKFITAFVLCIFDSFLRFNEARTLREDRIGPDGMVELLASETKSKRRRLVRLTDRTREAIAALEPRGYIFAISGELIGQTTMRDWFRRACVVAGVDERATKKDRQVQPRDGRAGGATTADETGARATAIQATVGHVSLETTQIYLRSDAADNANDVAKAMEKAIRRGPHRATRKKMRSSTRSLSK